MSDQAWKTLGKTDPFYAVLSQDKYRRSRMNPKNTDAFFESGRQHVALIREVLENDLRVPFAPKRVLDFGCGVGRVLIPLAVLAEQAVGADVAPGMLVEARNYADRVGAGNVQLVVSDDRLSTVSGSFDFIHSFIVFQHIAPKRGLPMLSHLLDRLIPGGLGAIHVIFAREISAPRKLASKLLERLPWLYTATNLLEGKPLFEPRVQMHAYSLNTVLQFLNMHSCHRIVLRIARHTTSLGAFLFFQKSTLPSIDFG